MKVKADKQGMAAISQLADMALRHSGLEALPAINAINAGFEEIKPPTETEKPAEEQ